MIVPLLLSVDVVVVVFVEGSEVTVEFWPGRSLHRAEGQFGTAIESNHTHVLVVVLLLPGSVGEVGGLVVVVVPLPGGVVVSVGSAVLVGLIEFKRLVQYY